MATKDAMKALVSTGVPVDLNCPGRSVKLVEKPIPVPVRGEVLVKMEASVCNPSDILALSGDYAFTTAENQTVGFEGCGRGIESSAGALCVFLKGKRVSCASQDGDGLWAEYATIPARQCIPVGENLPGEQAAALVVNPVTAYAMMQQAKSAGARAIVQTAGASQVGRGVISLGVEHGIETISIVRRDSQIPVLKNLGATHVLNQMSDTFDSEVKDVCERLKPTFFLECVGGEIAVRVQRHLPVGAEVIVYGLLDHQDNFSGRFSTQDLIFKNHTIRNFWLTPYFLNLSMLGGIKATNAVIKLFKEGVFNTTVASWSDFEEYPQAIDAYVSDMSSGKALLRVLGV